MPIRELVTRTYVGQGEHGPMHETVWHGRAAPPESVAEWVERRVAAMGPARSGAAGQVVERMLQAEDAAALKAAVSTGRELAEGQRWCVYKTLLEYRNVAREEYRPADELAGRLIAAWTAKWGAEPPRMAGW